jgi:hypothetical protein
MLKSEQQESISSTIYAPLFRKKVLLKAFFELKFFCAGKLTQMQNKMLVKSATGVDFSNILRAVFAPIFLRLKKYKPKM